MTYRRIARLAARCTLLAWFACVAGAASAAERTLPTARSPTQPAGRVHLECTNLRRLSDNYLLDLKIRMSFSRADVVYTRFENAGRGWQRIDQRPYADISPTRITLADDAALTAYVERLTGDYYHIDRTGTGVSLWGRCVLVGGLWRYL